VNPHRVTLFVTPPSRDAGQHEWLKCAQRGQAFRMLGGGRHDGHDLAPRRSAWRRQLMMVSVLLRWQASGMVQEYPNLTAYVARGEARPAYKRAFAAQLAVFTASSARG
jgi:hypothetical protein